MINNLSTIRNRNRFTVLAIADAAGVSAPTIYSWEKGTTFPTVEHLRRLAVFYAGHNIDLAIEDFYRFDPRVSDAQVI